MEDKTQEELIKESARALGKKGGSTTLSRYGKDHYKKMIEKRWNKHWEKVAREQKEENENLI